MTPLRTLKLLSGLALLLPFASQAFELSPDSVNGTYQLAQPERSAAGQVSKLKIEFGEINGKTMLATAGCDRCPPAVYSYLEEESKDLGRPVFFNSMGIYIIAYDDNTFVSAYPDGQLGKSPWKTLAYANVYNKQGTQGINLNAAKAFAIAQSQQIMNGSAAPEVVTGGNGKYFAAARHSINGQSFDQLELAIESKQAISLKGIGCRTGCTNDTFKYLADESQIIGKNVYSMGVNPKRFLIEWDKGIVLWTNGKLGEALWGKNDHFNVFAQSHTYVRKLTQDQDQQKAIDQQMVSYSQRLKDVFDQRQAKASQERIDRTTLPGRGMNDTNLESEVTTASKARANREGWNESIEYAYIRGNDWTILRNKLTGIQTGRYIPGVIVMKRKDGLCSYQSVHFAQQYNGSNYQKAYVYSIDSGQNKLDCAKI